MTGTTVVPVIKTLPDPPRRLSAKHDFTVKADASMAALVVMVEEANEAIEFVNQRAIDADDSAQEAAESATASQGFAEDADGHKQVALQAAIDGATYRDASQLAAGESAGSATASAGSAAAAAASVIAANAERVAAETAKGGAIEAKESAEYWADKAQQTVEGGIIDDTSLLDTRVRSALDTSKGNFKSIEVSADISIGILEFAQIVEDSLAITVSIPSGPEVGQMVMVGNFTNRTDHKIDVGLVPIKGQDAEGFLVLNKNNVTITLKYISADYGWEVM